MTDVGIDIGYNDTKVKTRRSLARFASIAGTPERSRFGLNGDAQNIRLTVPHDGTWLVGDGAVVQSRFATRREDRDWIESEEYYRLMLAAFTEAAGGSAALQVVTGLPVAFYEQDKEKLRDRFEGTHTVQREGRRTQTFTVEQCRVIPQPFGALLATAFNDRGRIVDQALATGHVGVIDIGGKTTNLLSVHRLAEIARETASVNSGAWDVVRAVRQFLAADCPDLDLRDHEIVQAIREQQTKYYGQVVDLTEIVEEALTPLAEQIIGQASQLWGSGARLEAVLVAGGGAHLIGPAIRRHFRHARVVENPVFANAVGYWRFAQYLNRK